MEQPRNKTQPEPGSPAEARAQAIEQLCDGFSHDTRNPLNAVVIHLEVLADKLRREHGGQVPFGLEKNLKAIKDQVNRLDEMVRRFVELAAPRRQHEQDFDLATLTQSVVEQCTHHARLSRGDVRTENLTHVRVPGSASELGIGLTLFLLAQVEAGAKRLVLRTEAVGGRAQLVVDGTVALDGAGAFELERVAHSLGGTCVAQAGRTEVSLGLGAPSPALHIVTESVTGVKP